MSVASLVHARLPALRALVPTRRHGDVDVLSVPVAHVRALLTFVRDDPDVACDHLVDVTVVDEGPGDRRDDRAPRFVLVVLLASRAHGSRVRVECALDDDDPAYPTLVPLWPGALLAERELWDLFGVMPEGHPSPRRLLCPDDAVGHAGRVDAADATTSTAASPGPTRRAAVIERSTIAATRAETP
jgi:NADH-quinone oxidoreductase subunit C